PPAVSTLALHDALPICKSVRWSTIVSLSQAMDIDPGEMTGKGNRVSHVGDASVLAVRNAIYDPANLPGMAVAYTEEPSTVDSLRSEEHTSELQSRFDLV